MVIKWMKKVKHGLESNALQTLKMLNCKQKIYFIYLLASGKILEECKLKGGTENSQKTFYIIRRPDKLVGLFSFYQTNAGKIKYALEKGYLPVIDMQNYANCYQSRNAEYNAWEAFFEQSCAYSLEEVYRSKNIILADVSLNNIMMPSSNMDFFHNYEGCRDFWKDLCSQYLKIRTDIQQEADKRYCQLTSQNDIVLGVAIRGTDYIRLKPPGHPVQPNVDVAVRDAEKLMQQYNCNKIFVNTEDSNIANYFKLYFKEKYIWNDRKLVHYSDGYIVDNMRNDKFCDQVQSGREYLITQLMLNKTDHLLASRTSGVVGSATMCTNWKTEQYYDLGLYPAKDENM